MAKTPVSFFGNTGSVSNNTASIELPKSISDLVAWWDASDLSTFRYRTSNYISRWSDKSGNGYFAYNNETSNPKYQSNGVFFEENTSDYLLFKQMSFTGAWSIIASVSFNPSEGETTRMFISSDTSSNFITKFGNYSPNSTALFRMDNDATGITPANYWTADAKTVMTCVRNSSDLVSVYKNNSFVTSATQAGTGILAAMGRAYLAAQHWRGYIHEILIYNKELSTSERTSLEKYLISKWGVV